MPALGRHGGRLALLLFGLAAGLGSAEALFRILLVSPTVPRTEREFARIVASTWPRPIEAGRREGTLRILGLGDSFGVSGGEENFHYLAARSLSDQGIPAEVVNFSVGGYSLLDESLLIERFAERYRPDIVLHSVFMGNDFIVPKEESFACRGIPVEITPGWRGWMPWNWTLPRWTGGFAMALSDRRRAEAERDDAGGAATFSKEKFLWIEGVRMSTFKRPSREVVAWPDVTRALDRTLARVIAMGAKYILVAHPDQAQVEEPLRAEILAAMGASEADYDMDLPAKFLEAYARARHVDIVNLTPVFREKGSSGGLYLLRDTHYNAEGNRLAARALEDPLRHAAGSDRPFIRPNMRVFPHFTPRSHV